MSRVNYRATVEHLSRSLGACAIFAVLLSGLLYATAWGDIIHASLNHAWAWSTASIANLFGMSATNSGTSVHGPTRTIRIVNECNVLNVWVLMASATFLIPMPPRHRFYRVAQAGLACLVTNQVRLLILLYSIHFHTAWWPIVHGPPMKAACAALVVIWFIRTMLAESPSLQPPNATRHA